MSNNLLYDAHCHLEQIITNESTHRAIAAVTKNDWSKLVAYRELQPNVKIGFGIHPWHVDSGSSTNELEELLRAQIQLHQPNFIGETGLDALKPDLNLQIEYLNIHLKLAQEFNLPIVLHCVRAHNQLLQVLGSYPHIRGMVHAYNGNADNAKQYRRKNMQLGIGSTILNTTSQLCKSISHIPLEQILIESDAPYMPQVHQLTSSSDDCIIYATELAHRQQKKLTEVISEVNQNWLHLFS